MRVVLMRSDDGYPLRGHRSSVSPREDPRCSGLIFFPLFRVSWVAMPMLCVASVPSIHPFMPIVAAAACPCHATKCKARLFHDLSLLGG